MSFACWEGGCVVDETKNLVIFAPFFCCINKASNSTMTSHARPFSPRDWEHHLVVLTYSGCVFDTSTQKAEGIEWI